MRLLERAAAAAAVVGVLAVATANAAELVVLESTAAAYSPGQTIDAALPIKLAAGEALVIATDDGRLLRVEGPHDGAAAGVPAPESAVRKVLDQLVSANPPRVGGVGAVRGELAADSAPDSRPEPWLVHVQRSGDQCALRGEPVSLWREAAGGEAAAEIADAADGTTAQVRWTAAEPRAAWPAELPTADGRIYLVRFAGATRSVAIRINLIAPPVTASKLASAGWLAAKGCTAQARLALR